MKKKPAILILLFSLVLLSGVLAYSMAKNAVDERVIADTLNDNELKETSKEPESLLIPNLRVDENAQVSVDRNYLILTEYAGEGELSFSSFDEEIVRVSDEGMLTGVHPGETDVAVKLASDGVYRSWSQNVHVTVSAPDISKSIFLTYDDGPSENITPELLDTLKRYNAHATFFIIGNYAKLYPEIVKRAYDEGHTIAIHTYTHDYRKIYASIDAYIEDFDETEALIEEITGNRPRFWRFPGGSNNGYTAHASQYEIMDRLRERGYTPMDWNVSTTDAAPDYPSAATMVEKGSEFIDQAIASGQTPVVLMHDSETKVNACAATEAFIEKYSQLGYDFRGLEDYYGDGIVFLK